MKYKLFLIYILVFAIVYSILIIVISPFLISWGDKPNFLEQAVNLLFTFPINWRALIVEKSLLYVFINGVFWGFLLIFIRFVFKKLFLIKH